LDWVLTRTFAAWFVVEVVIFITMGIDLEAECEVGVIGAAEVSWTFDVAIQFV
jgi:hypothetical protein